MSEASALRYREDLLKQRDTPGTPNPPGYKAKTITRTPCWAQMSLYCTTLN